ncbi:hypothetical protein BXY57_0612 [Thermoflavifilum aggregans]|uniref:Uncharacterized protein n=1 Tax=Thermoflavifilum aggregans TaxID=454188 RepID=A0A2M9CT09_9BACT|nr:hypothetical protein [Thermoflavifilum aggregans]PJJ75044.1 hypothetical protein BXY57_0612 [Thermoflavifilum aggregans]
MKQYPFILLIMCLIWGMGFSNLLKAQQPTKKEMEDMQKMMEQMKNDPDMQKAMKQFGIDSKSIDKLMNNPSNISSNSYYEFDEFQVPKKNVSRINAIPALKINNSNLPEYLRIAQKCVEASLNTEQLKMVHQLLSYASSSPDTLAYMASGLWMSGLYLPATYVMAEASRLKPNVTNLNNFSAFLVMTGAEELALPVLQKLNRENPKNRYILNNIGQAWFGLGDLDNAIKYLDSTILIFPTHSQANQTKCVIQNAKGDKAGAIQSMKQSVKGAYSSTKENMLRKLGYKLEATDLNNSDLHMPADPLGFAKWMAIIPPFPKSYKEQMLLPPKWKDFYQQILDERTKLSEKASRLNMEYADSLVKRAERFKANPFKNQFKEPYLYAKADIILKYYTDDKDGHNAAKAKMINEEMKLTYDNMETYKTNAYQKYEKLKRRYFDPIGEGQQLPPGDMCKEVINLYNSWIKSSNSELEAFTIDFLKYKSKRLEAIAYFTQYTTDLQPLIDFTETSMKLAFLADLENIKPLLDYQSNFAWGCIQSELEKSHEENRKLADWDDLHCDKNITFSVPGIGSYHFSCNATSVNLDPLILPFKASFEQNLNTGEFVNATGSVGYGPVDVGAEYDFVKDNGAAFVEASTTVINENHGPIKINAGVKGRATIEFDKNGPCGLELEASGSVKVGNDAITVKGDTNVKWGWEAGGSGEAKGSIDSKALSTAIKAINFIKK